MKRIISISLLLIFLSGQFNLTWATQFCDEFDVKINLMLGHGYLYCCEGEKPSCDNSEDNSDGVSFASPDCCWVDYYSADSDDYFNHNQSLLTSGALFASAYVISFFENTITDHHQEFISTESPPLTQENQQVLYQTFLL